MISCGLKQGFHQINIPEESKDIKYIVMEKEADQDSLAKREMWMNILRKILDC